MADLSPWEWLARLWPKIIARHDLVQRWEDYYAGTRVFRPGRASTPTPTAGSRSSPARTCAGCVSIRWCTAWPCLGSARARRASSAPSSSRRIPWLGPIPRFRTTTPASTAMLRIRSITASPAIRPKLPRRPRPSSPAAMAGIGTGWRSTAREHRSMAAALQEGSPVHHALADSISARQRTPRVTI